MNTTVDVGAEIEIGADPADVAAVMFDASRTADWMQAVDDVELIDAALVPGARVRYRGRVMGRELVWESEVETVHFPHVLVLRIAEGPLAGTLRFDIQRSAAGSRARVRSSGEPGGLGAMLPALLREPMRAALAADLGRLKALVER